MSAVPKVPWFPGLATSVLPGYLLEMQASHTGPGPIALVGSADYALASLPDHSDILSA